VATCIPFKIIGELKGCSLVSD